MQITEPTNQRIKALAVQATEIKQVNDHCSGQSETWSEVNFDAFVKMLVEECISVIDHHSSESEQNLAKIEPLKLALRSHFGLPLGKVFKTPVKPGWRDRGATETMAP